MSDNGFRDKTTEKTIAALFGQWNAEINMFGMLIAASSIIAAIEEVHWSYLLVVLVLSFTGVLSVIVCYWSLKESYKYVLYLTYNPEEFRRARVGEGEGVAHAGRVYFLERAIHVILLVATLAFILMCLCTFYS